ncbi:MAG: hypothetical protein LBC63_10405 [Holophagales bacterium]|jgi:hypothetical protein|nr:hypothetical protein [Holophagales bacterium]
MKALSAICFLTAFSAIGFAQEPPQRPPREGMGRQMQPYDASKEETIKGKVTNVAEMTRGQMTVITLTVSVDGKDWQVNVGTADFLKEKGVSFAKDDEITIKGVKNETERGARISAKEVTKGETTLELLNKDGRPAWIPAPPPIPNR